MQIPEGKTAYKLAAFPALMPAFFLVRLSLGRPYSGPAELLLLNGFFVVMFAVSAWLFRRAARPVHRSAPPVV